MIRISLVLTFFLCGSCSHLQKRSEAENIHRDPTGVFRACRNFYQEILDLRTIDKRNFDPRFTYIKKIGEGGQGQIDLYLDKNTGKKVVVKKYETSIYPRSYRNELAFYEYFDYLDGIPKLVSSGQKQYDYLVLSHRPTVSLYRSLIKGELTKFDVVERVKALLDISRTLVRIHQKDVLHLDIKPENILIDEDGNGVLIDFGSVHYSFSKKKYSFLTSYTPAYAPKGMMKESPTPKHDVYSLGMTLADIFKFFDSVKQAKRVLGEKAYHEMMESVEDATDNTLVNRLDLASFIQRLKSIINELS